MEWIVLLIVLGVIATILLLSLWVIGPTEMGVFTFLGKIVRVEIKSGPCFGPPRPLGQVVRFPTTQLRLEYEALQPITRKGWYYQQIQKIENLKEKSKKEKVSPEKKKIEEELRAAEERLEEIKKEKPEDESEKCESIEIDKVGVTVYLRYPNKKENLEKALIIIGGAKDEQSLKKHYHDFVVGCLRDVLSKMPWRAVIENREHIALEMRLRFTEEGSPFILAGFKPEDIYVAITLIDLPDKLARLLSLPQEEFLKAEAAKREAEKRAIEAIGTVIEMMARARGKKAEDIQKEIESQPELKKEFLDLAKDLVVRKLGIEGRSYLDVRVDGAEGLERLLLNVLAVWQRMPMGATVGKETKKDAEKKEKIPDLEEVLEEIEKEEKK